MLQIENYFQPGYFLLSLLIAITGFVYSNILIEPGQIFGKWYSFLSKLFKKDERDSQGLPAHPLFSVLIYCEKCVSGQMMLWTFTIYNFRTYQLLLIIPHLLYIGFTIFTVIIIKKLYTKYID